VCVGTFLIRFSESVPGAFAVAYVTTDQREKVKHFLVYAILFVIYILVELIFLSFCRKPKDLGHNRTLPDYLREHDEFALLAKLRRIDDW
jgi:hypothetical protein